MSVRIMSVMKLTILAVSIVVGSTVLTVSVASSQEDASICGDIQCNGNACEERENYACSAGYIVFDAQGEPQYCQPGEPPSADPEPTLCCTGFKCVDPD